MSRNANHSTRISTQRPFAYKYQHVEYNGKHTHLIINQLQTIMRHSLSIETAQPSSIPESLVGLTLQTNITNTKCTVPPEWCQSPCVQGANGMNPTIALLGDSHTRVRIILFL